MPTPTDFPEGLSRYGYTLMAVDYLGYEPTQPPVGSRTCKVCGRHFYIIQRGGSYGTTRYFAKPGSRAYNNRTLCGAQRCRVENHKAARRANFDEWMEKRRAKWRKRPGHECHNCGLRYTPIKIVESPLPPSGLFIAPRYDTRDLSRAKQYCCHDCKDEALAHILYPPEYIAEEARKIRESWTPGERAARFAGNDLPDELYDLLNNSLEARKTITDGDTTLLTRQQEFVKPTYGAYRWKSS
jgi:hypothetical protein